MNIFKRFLFILYLLRPLSAYDIFEGFWRLGTACFEVITVPETCNRTLAQSYQSDIPQDGNNEPTTAMFLFTSDNKDIAEPLHLCGGQLPPESKYDKDADTEIFIHGWLDGVCRSAWMREMKEQLFIRGRYNVILVDWTWGNTPDYFLAGSNSRIVGQQVGFVVNNILRQTGVSPRKIHLIGHSFGAIASGFAGRKIKGLRRITALDPALAPFRDAPPEGRVTYRDAEIVDVIHSNAGLCFATNIGDPRQLGDADFYPNGGTVQLSCYPYILTSLFKGDLLYALVSVDPRICYHVQSIQFYKVSINPNGCQFVGVSEDNKYAVMGMDYEKYRLINDNERRNFSLYTGLFCPYQGSAHLGGAQFPFNSNCIA